MDIAKLAVDPALENLGTWIEYDHETRLFVRSLRSKPYRDTYQREIAAIRRTTRKPTQEQTEEMLHKCYAESILMQWQGVTENGQVLDCTLENKIRVFKTCPSVWDFVVQSVTAYETFHREELEEAKAVLGEVSHGNSGTR